MLADGNGGIWIGAWGVGLVHRDNNGQWTVFSKTNSGLPGDFVFSLLSDSNGNIWVGTDDGLARMDTGGKWVVFNESNSGLPDNWVISLLNDGKGGIWLGTTFRGLAHLDASEKWTVFNKLFLNGSFVTGDATLAVKNITTSTTTQANTPFTLKTQATVAQGDVQQVWAVVRPPRIDLLLDSYNTPILAFPRVILAPTTDNEWQGTWTDTRYNGEYKITFYAKDKDGDVVSSDETITLTVTDGINPPATAR